MQLYSWGNIKKHFISNSYTAWIVCLCTHQLLTSSYELLIVRSASHVASLLPNAEVTLPAVLQKIPAATLGYVRTSFSELMQMLQLILRPMLAI